MFFDHAGYVENHKLNKTWHFLFTCAMPKTFKERLRYHAKRFAAAGKTCQKVLRRYELRLHMCGKDDVDEVQKNSFLGLFVFFGDL